MSEAHSNDIETWDPVRPNGETASLIERHRSENWLSLTPDRRAFAIAYMETNSHVLAAQQINKPGMGMKYYRDPQVLALISDLQAEAFEYSVITEAFVQNQLVGMLPKLMGEEEVWIIDKEGDSLSRKKFHASEARAAISALGDSLKRVNGTTLNVNTTKRTEVDVSIKDVENLYAAIAAKQPALTGDVAAEEGGEDVTDVDFEEIVDD